MVIRDCLIIKNTNLTFQIALMLINSGIIKMFSIKPNDTGISLKASGWGCEDDSCGGGGWNRLNRKREETIYNLFETKKKYPTVKKQRWVKEYKPKCQSVKT